MTVSLLETVLQSTSGLRDFAEIVPLPTATTLASSTTQSTSSYSSTIGPSVSASAKRGHHTNFGTKDDYFWYFWPDKNRNLEDFKKPIFAEIDNLGYVPPKVKFFAYSQGIIKNMNEIQACFSRPLHRRRPRPTEGWVYTDFKLRHVSGHETKDASNYIRYATPSKQIVEMEDDENRALAIQFNRGTKKDPDWIWCLLNKTYWDGQETSDMVKLESPGVWIL